MQITAHCDYAIRVLAELAAAAPAPIKADRLAASQDIPAKVLESVLGRLREGEFIRSRRGPDGGYWLNRPAADISIADVIRLLEGPLASVRGQRPEDVVYDGPAKQLTRVWVAVRTNMRSVLEEVSIQQLADDALPGFIDELTAEPGAWHRREAES